MSIQESAQSRIVEAAQKILAGEMDIVEGCRLLLYLQQLLNDPNDELFMTFIVIASETEHFPVGELRSRWHKDSLARVDAEVGAYITRVRKSVMEACTALVKEYSAPGECT